MFPKSFFFSKKISKRVDDDISSLLIAISAETKGPLIKKIRIAFGGMSDRPKRALKCERILLNSTLSDKIIDKAKASISEEFSPISDVRASKKYRTMVAMNLLEKAMIEMKQKQMVETNVRN